MGESYIDWWRLFFMFLSVIVAIAFLVGMFMVVQRAVYGKDLSWCFNNRPMINDSSNDKISYCYNEGWNKYCKMSYPTHCPIVEYGVWNN